MRYLTILLICCAIYSCHSKSGGFIANNNQYGISEHIKYAKGFSINRAGNIKILRVYNPWEGAKGIEYTYALCPKGQQVPYSLQDIPVIYTPIKRIVCLSTTHIALLSAIDKINTLVGVAGPGYISDPIAQEMIQKGMVKDIGYDQALNYEVLVNLKPDVVLAYGIQGETASQYKKLEELGITVVLNGEYLESSPLGKMEWIKFLAAFYDVSDDASTKFEIVEQEYLHFLKICDHVINKPKIITGLPWKGAWYVPGGKSYIAQMISDAGGEYVWGDIGQYESVPLSFEKVIERAGNADIWINTGNAGTRADILNEDGRLKNLKPYKQNNIYNNTALTNPTGGNDFWESGITHPQIILQDLIKIFHPGLLPNHSLVYYKKLH